MEEIIVKEFTSKIPGDPNHRYEHAIVGTCEENSIEFCAFPYSPFIAGVGYIHGTVSKRAVYGAGFIGNVHISDCTGGISEYVSHQFFPTREEAFIFVWQGMREQIEMGKEK